MSLKCIFIFCLVPLICLVTPSQCVKYKTKLGSNYTLVWEVLENEYISFSAFVRTNGWVGFGLNDKPKMDGADLLILGVKDERPYFFAYHGVGHQLVLEENTHWEIGYGKFLESPNSTITLVNFGRQLDSGHKDALTIEDKELYLLWSYGEDDDVNKKHVDRGVIRVNLVNPNPNSTVRL